MSLTLFQCIRKIIHIDCDCFYAAVEMRDDPSLKNKAIAVGGSADRRGVVATCNYAAREFGVHSAMATATALRKCPQLVVIAPRMAVYRDVSKSIAKIYRQYTDLIEPLSLDEAYLDVSACTQHQGSATWIAQAIRAQIEKELGISASAGIAPNKFLAKIASDWNKPNGQFVVLPHQVEDFVKTLAVKKIHGVGAVTNKKMLGLNIKTCEDLQALSRYQLSQHFGSFGERLYLYSRGIDNRPVKTSRQRKSISVEYTYDQDLQCLDDCYKKIPELLNKLNQRCAAYSEDISFKNLYVKMKFSDFTSTTVEDASALVNEDNIKRLFEIAYLRKNDTIENAACKKINAVRLLGIGVRIKPPAVVSDNKKIQQLSLF